MTERTCLSHLSSELSEISIRPLQMNHELELAFYNRVTVCLSLYLYLYLLTLSSASVDETASV